MKLMTYVKKFGSNLVKLGKNVKDKALGLFVAGGALMAGASNARADVAFDSATKTFSGELDLTPFYSSTGIAIGAIATVTAIGLAIAMFRRVR